MKTRKLCGFVEESTLRSAGVKSTEELNEMFVVNSPARRDPKKLRQQAANNMTLSGLDKSNDWCRTPMTSAVTGWRRGGFEPWWRLIPLKRRWSWRQLERGLDSHSQWGESELPIEERSVSKFVRWPVGEDLTEYHDCRIRGTGVGLSHKLDELKEQGH